MDKNQTLEAMLKARKSHETQMTKIEAALNGERVENPTSVSKRSCNFGKLLYTEENHMEEILGELFYDRLEKAHAQWHLEYARIYNIFYKEEKKGFFSSLLGSSQKVDGLELDKAKLYYLELEETTKELLNVFGSCERRVSAMSEAKFH
jgi:hypothetical protein